MAKLTKCLMCQSCAMEIFVGRGDAAPRGVTEQLVRAWNVPEDAVLNLEQEIL